MSDTQSKCQLPCCKACGAKFQPGMAGVIVVTGDLDSDEIPPGDGVYHVDCAPREGS